MGPNYSLARSSRSGGFVSTKDALSGCNATITDAGFFIAEPFVREGKWERKVGAAFPLVAATV